MLRRLRTAGVEARAVATETLLSRPAQSVDLIRYMRTALRFAAYMVHLIPAALWADVIHAVSAASGSFVLEAPPAVILGRMMGKRVVLNYHAGEVVAVARVGTRRSDVRRVLGSWHEYCGQYAQ